MPVVRRAPGARAARARPRLTAIGDDLRPTTHSVLPTALSASAEPSTRRRAPFSTSPARHGRRVHQIRAVPAPRSSPGSNPSRGPNLFRTTSARRIRSRRPERASSHSRCPRCGRTRTAGWRSIEYGSTVARRDLLLLRLQMLDLDQPGCCSSIACVSLATRSSSAPMCSVGASEPGRRRREGLLELRAHRQSSRHWVAGRDSSGRQTRAPAGSRMPRAASALAGGQGQYLRRAPCRRALRRRRNSA